MKENLKALLKAFALIIILFLPFYLITPSQEKKEKGEIIKVNPESFRPQR